MLPVWIRCYLKSVLRYNLLILDNYHPDTLCLRVQGCDDPWLFFEAKSGPRAKPFGLTIVIPMCIWTNKCESNSV